MTEKPLSVREAFLRDDFARTALGALLQFEYLNNERKPFPYVSDSQRAERAYELADAMMEARKK
jgi:hypothetical protein